MQRYMRMTVNLDIDVRDPIPMIHQYDDILSSLSTETFNDENYQELYNIFPLVQAKIKKIQQLMDNVDHNTKQIYRSQITVYEILVNTLNSFIILITNLRDPKILKLTIPKREKKNAKN